jgi:flagellar protein FlaI
MHADSVSSAVHRLENPPISVPRILIPIMNAMAVQVQARKDGRLVRRVKEVTEMLGIDPGTGDVLTNGVFRWDGDADRHRYLGSSRCMEHFMQRRGLDDRGLEAEWERRTRILQWMADGGMHRITDVHRVVRDYYRRPDAVMKMVEAERGA